MGGNLRAVTTLLSAAVLVCRAMAGIDERQYRVDLDTISKPSVVVVHDFEIDARDVTVDTTGPAFASSGGDKEARIAERACGTAAAGRRSPVRAAQRSSGDVLRRARLALRRPLADPLREPERSTGAPTQALRTGSGRADR